MSDLIWPDKDPDEVKDYDVDWTEKLCSKDELAILDATGSVVPADTIATSTFILPTGTLVANSTSNNTTHTKIWLSAGTEPIKYRVVNRIITSQGRTFDRTCRVKVKSK